MGSVGFEAMVKWYIDNEMSELPSACFSVFTVIASFTFGHLSDVKPVCIDDIIDKMKCVTRTVRNAVEILEDRGLVKKFKSDGGRGHRSYYGINDAYLKLCKNSTSLEINCAEKTLVKNGTIHGFKNVDSIKEGMSDNGRSLRENAVDKTTSSCVIDKEVDEIYEKYPGRCPTAKRSTGKSHKQKELIKRLLKSGWTKDRLSKLIEAYVEDRRKTRTYLQNFSTFLHNLPDENELFKKLPKKIFTVEDSIRDFEKAGVAL